MTHLFDNGGTVFFAIFMAIWGRWRLFVPFSDFVNTCWITSTVPRLIKTLLEFKSIYTIVYLSSCFHSTLDSAIHVKHFNQEFNTVNTLQCKYRRFSLWNTFVSKSINDSQVSLIESLHLNFRFCSGVISRIIKHFSRGSRYHSAVRVAELHHDSGILQLWFPQL